MSLEALKTATHRTVGAKQTLKALARGTVTTLFVAQDADQALTRPLVQMAEQQGRHIVAVDSMVTLGKACLIDVGAAVAAIINE